MSQHRCAGDDCGFCAQRIEQAEYDRDCPADDYPDYYDGT